MTDDPNQPVVLTTRPTEAQAALVAAALKERGIEARTTGEYTSGLLAAATGEVRILVRQSDLERARAVLRTIESEPS